MLIHPTVYTVPYGLTYQLTSSVSASAILPPILDRLSVQPSAAYAFRKLKSQYSGAAIRVRRSADNAELDIGFSTTTQTRTNLAAIPVNNNGGNTASGVTMTTVGSGTEFGLPYVDVRWQGTATAAGYAQFMHSSVNAFNPTIHAPATGGLAYTASVSYRLAAGSLPAGVGGWTMRMLCRLNNGGTATPLVVGQIIIPTPTASIQRISTTAIVSPNTAYVQPNMYVAIALNEVVDFTMRFYAVNVEQGVGNARPLLQRNVAETIANIGDMDTEALLAFNSSENLLTFSEDLTNVGWVLAGAAVTANNAVAPNGLATAETVVEDTAVTTQHRFSRSLALTANQLVTLSIFVKRGVGARHFQLGISGGTLIASAYFDLGDGTVGLTDNCTASVTAAANNFWRVSLTATPDTTVTHSLFFAMTNNTTLGSETYTGDGVSSVILWGAQFNTGSVALPYKPTTSTAQAFNINTGAFGTTWYDQGRYWNASRRNLVTYSEEIDNTAWRKISTGVASAPVVTANAGLAPNGTLTADRVQFALNGGTTIGDQSLIDQSAATTIAGQPYVYSFWARTFDASTRTIQLSANGALNVNCTVTPTWQRFSLVYPSALDTVRNITIRLRGTFGTSDSADLLIWGIQQEQSSILTEYQPILAGTPLNAAQATAGNQPSIVTQGAIVTEKLKPSLRFGAALSLTTLAFGTSPQRTINSVNTYSPSSGYQYVWEQNSSGATVGNGFLVNSLTFADWIDGDMVAFGDGYSAGRNPRFVSDGRTASSELDVYSVSLGSELNRIRVDGVNATSRVSGLGNFPASAAIFGISRTTGNQGLVGSVSELIYMDTSLPDTDLQTLERNQGQYFSIPIA